MENRKNIFDIIFYFSCFERVNNLILMGYRKNKKGSRKLIE